MKRKIYDNLLKWKNGKDTRPLMVLGARQVGKTYIVDEFCKCEYGKKYYSVTLFERQDIIDLYADKSLTSDEKFNHLKILVGGNIEEEGSILFIDEIQRSHELISELKYFNEKHENMRIICSSSLLGVELSEMETPFPVGKVKELLMYQMDFEEFLWSCGLESLADEIKKNYETMKPLPEPIHNKALEFYRYYLITGGMPKSVKNFIDNDFDLVRFDTTIKEDILKEYFKDMNQYIKNKSLLIKVQQTYNSIAPILANDNKKFKYNQITNDARARDFELPLDWLEKANLIYKNYRVTTPLIPLEGFKDKDSFKVFYNDLGFVVTNLKIKAKDIITDNLSLYKGAIAENYVASTLVSNGCSLYYWKSDGIAETDFLLYTDDGVIPIEVKANTNTQSKSLNTYIDKFKPAYAIRISAKNFGYDADKKLKSIPLYAVFCIKE